MSFLLQLSACTPPSMVVEDAAGNNPGSANQASQTTPMDLNDEALALIDQRDFPAAAEKLSQAESLASSTGEAHWLPVIFNNQALLASRDDQWLDAARLFEKSALDSSGGNSSLLRAKAWANVARALSHTNRIDKAITAIYKSAENLQGVTSAADRAAQLINLAYTGLAIVARHPNQQKTLIPLIEYFTSTAERDALDGDTPLNRVYALGYQGWLRQIQNKPTAAIELTQRALFLNQQLAGGESTQAAYVFHTRLAQLHQKQKQPLEAISAFQMAARQLELLRSEVLLHEMEKPFLGEDSPQSVYRNLLSLLFSEARQAGDPKRRQTFLQQARNTAEKMKAAEIRDYFRDDCVDTLQAKLREVGKVSADTAIIYPIVLQDRLELLLDHPRLGLQQRTVPVEEKEIRQTAARLRDFLEARSNGFVQPAEQLYRWLIEPLQEVLQSPISTLVFVPSGQLGTVPMAALKQPGGGFLIEKFSVAVTPGIELTDPQPLDRSSIRPLYAGLTEEQDNFPALLAVRDEIHNASRIFPGKILLDTDFRQASLRQALRDDRLSIVHFATHGQFGDTVNDSFILTRDGPLNMDELAGAIGQFKYRDQPLDLLVLSACETASGSARASLGLSGIAIKAGARSAIGTLWKVNDQAGAELMSEFYRALNNPDLSRAEALQKAQLSLRHGNYANPGYWSPYILINSWL